MASPIVHVEIIGRDPVALRRFYAELFGWRAATGTAVASEVSDAGAYGFIDPEPGSLAPAAGIGGGPGWPPSTVFYVGVPNVTEALAHAVELGGTVALAPVERPDGALVVAHFADDEGNVVGLAGPE